MLFDRIIDSYQQISLRVYNKDSTQTMDRENRNNRSLLALAGENSLTINSSKANYQPSIARIPQSEFMINKPNSRIRTEYSTSFDPKQVIKKLGLARLRKMQALVRGFLVRRKVYPKELEQYLVAQSALDLIIANVLYRQVSGLVVQTVTLGHYDQGEGGEDRMIEEYLYNAVIKRVIEKEFAPIARQAVYQTAIYASRPQITFGFNLRDPLQLSLYLKLNSIIEQECRGLVEESLRQQALQRRQLQIIDSLILDMAVITDLCHQVVDQCLLEGVEDYAVQQIFTKITKEAAIVVAEVVYNQQVLKIQNKFLDSLNEQAEEWLLQEFMLTLICDPQKLQPNNQ